MATILLTKSNAMEAAPLFQKNKNRHQVVQRELARHIVLCENVTKWEILKAIKYEKLVQTTKKD